MNTNENNLNKLENSEVKDTVVVKEKKMKKKALKNPKKMKKIITAVSTMILSMLLLVSVTYAWFTLTNKPKIEGFMLKVGTTGSLQISDSQNGTFGDKITFSGMENLCLKPLTTLDGKTFHKPATRDESGKVKTLTQVTDLAAITNKSNAEGGYIIKKEFWLKATTETKSSAEIKLVAGSKSGKVATGTMIYSGKKAKNDGAAAVRVSFSPNITSSVTKILEPNYDVTEQGDVSQEKLTNWSESNPATIQQASDGKFKGQTDGKSGVLFSIPANTATKIDMYIWLEGADKQCVNDIQGDEIHYNFQFISDDVE